MNATPFRHGTGWAVPLDAETAERLGLSDEAEVEVRVEGELAVIAPAAGLSDEELQGAITRVKSDYDALFERLA